MHRPNGSKWWKLVARRSWCQPTTKVLGDDSSTLGCEEHVILPPILLWFEKVLNHIHTNEKITSCDPHHDIYTFCYWQIFWHSI